MDFKEYNGKFAGDTNAGEIIRLSKQYIGNRVLDIGAGSGALIERLPNAIGIDLAPKHPRIIKGNVLSLPFNNEYFDTIFATEFLEHLDDETLHKGLEEISRVLKVGSAFIITVPYNEELDDNMVTCPKCKYKFHRWGHTRSFSDKVIKDHLEKNNFAIIQCKLLPIGFMSRHQFLKYFIKIFNLVGYLQKRNHLFVIAIKT